MTLATLARKDTVKRLNIFNMDKEVKGLGHFMTSLSFCLGLYTVLRSFEFDHLVATGFADVLNGNVHMPFEIAQETGSSLLLSS